MKSLAIVLLVSNTSAYKLKQKFIPNIEMFEKDFLPSTGPIADDHIAM